jgi:hypothetical protein
MRTKTLLIAAAALAVGIISSEAQVYSQNVVGYVNLTVTNHTFAMVANQLDTGSNTVDNVLPSGAVSSSTTLLLWNGAAFQQFIYYNADDSPDGNVGWYDVSTQNPCTNNLNIGAGAFIHNPSASDITLTTVGQVVQGTNQYTIASGYNIYSIPEPVATNIDSALVNFPAVSSSDTYLQYNGTGYNQLIYYNADDSPDGNTGWYDISTQVLESGNPAYWPKVGQSFFIHHPGSALTWTNAFIVP